MYPYLHPNCVTEAPIKVRTLFSQQINLTFCEAPELPIRENLFNSDGNAYRQIRYHLTYLTIAQIMLMIDFSIGGSRLDSVNSLSVRNKTVSLLLKKYDVMLYVQLARPGPDWGTSWYTASAIFFTRKRSQYFFRIYFYNNTISTKYSEATIYFCTW